MNFQRMTDLDLAGKRVLIREDLNVPAKMGNYQRCTFTCCTYSTIKAALDKGAAVMVFSHLGRPERVSQNQNNLFAPVAALFNKLL